MGELTMIETTEPRALVLTDRKPARLPAVAYIAGLSEGGWRVVRHAHDTMLGMLTGVPDALECDWSAVTYAHTSALRAKPVQDYAPATANRMLSALRGTLKAAWLSSRRYSSDQANQKDPGAAGSSSSGGLPAAGPTGVESASDISGASFNRLDCAS